MLLKQSLWKLNGEQLVKVASWYDNEMSYTAQLIMNFSNIFVNSVKIID